MAKLASIVEESEVQFLHRSKKCGGNDHLRSRWLEFSAIGRKGKRTSVLLSLNLQPGAEHPVCMARINMRGVFALLSLSAFLYFFGCSGANYGSIKHSRDVTQAFETYHVYPEHRYYYLNQENNPYAVVALQNGYTISDNRWIEFDPQTDKLEKVVELVKRFPVNYSNAYGSYLKDSKGSQVGYWYSSLPIRSLKVDNETKKVSIYTESPWLRDEERGFGTGGGVGIGVGSGGSGIGIRIGR